MPSNALPPSAALLRSNGSSVRVLCLVNHIADHGGAEVSTVEIVRRLHGAGISFGVATLFNRYSTRYRAELEERGIAIFSCDARTWLQRASNFRRVVREFRPDVVHSTLAHSDLIARTVAGLERVPHMSSIVSPTYSKVARASNANDWKLDVWRFADGWTARRWSSAFHAITHAVAAAAVSALHIDARRITVIPRGRDRSALGVPSKERRARTRGALGLSEDTPVILNLGRHVPAKGQVHLVRAFAHVQRRYPSAVLLNAGREDLVTPTLKRSVAELGLQGNVRFLGISDDVGSLLSAADVFAFSSVYEGFGGALIEAMAMGLPIVAFDAPAMSEVVGTAGRLVPLADEQAFAESIVELIASRETREELARAGVDRFERYFTIDVVTEKMRALYEGVARNAEPR
jgi:glycosyltransferase involved in cell wall biosynthesis